MCKCVRMNMKRVYDFIMSQTLKIKGNNWTGCNATQCNKKQNKTKTRNYVMHCFQRAKENKELRTNCFGSQKKKLVKKKRKREKGFSKRFFGNSQIYVIGLIVQKINEEDRFRIWLVASLQGTVRTGYRAGCMIDIVIAVMQFISSDSIKWRLACVMWK